jgi:hypothetical protein
VSKDTSSCIVSTLIACCVTSLCRAPLGMAVYVCGGFAGIAFRFDLRGGLSSMNLTFGNNGKTGSINVGTGTIPGVLFLVTHLWSLAVFFNALYAVGFCDCMMFGASVICGIVNMGVLLITLGCSLRTACVRASHTLCSSTLGGGAKSFLIPCSSFWSNCCHFGVSGTPMAISFNSFVSSCRCWCGIISGSWQCWGNNSADPDIR